MVYRSILCFHFQVNNVLLVVLVVVRSTFRNLTYSCGTMFAFVFFFLLMCSVKIISLTIVLDNKRWPIMRLVWWFSK